MRRGIGNELMGMGGNSNVASHSAGNVLDQCLDSVQKQDSLLSCYRNCFHISIKHGAICSAVQTLPR